MEDNISSTITEMFNSFQDCLNNEQEVRECTKLDRFLVSQSNESSRIRDYLLAICYLNFDFFENESECSEMYLQSFMILFSLPQQIRIIVKNIEKNSRDILMILQNIHTVHHTMEENIIVSKYCSKAREIFGDIRIQYSNLSEVVPSNQYYRYHDQWRFVTQRLCFLVALVIYFEIKLLVDKKTVADILGMKDKREDGFHLDLEDFLLGLLQLSAELSRFAVNSVTNGHYHWPMEIATFVNELNAGFRLLNLKNDILRKRFDALKYDVKKIEEVVYDLCIRGLIPSPRPVEEMPIEETPTE